MLSFYSGNELNFDYNSCLASFQDLEYQEDLKEIGELYEKRGDLSEAEVSKYVGIARDLTQKVVKSPNKR